MKPLILPFAAILAVMVPSAGSVAQSAESYESVTYEVPYSVHLTFHWRVDRDGSGEIMRIVDDPDQISGERRWHDLQLRTEAREQFNALMTEALLLAGQLPPCDRVVIDGVLGSITWTGPAGTRTLVFSGGCMGPEYEAVRTKILEANFLVERRAIIYREPFRVERF